MPRRFRFDCPACEAEVFVDGDIRAEVLEDGCLLCRTAVGTDSFVPVSESDR